MRYVGLGLLLGLLMLPAPAEARDETGQPDVARELAALTSENPDQRVKARDALLAPLLFELPRTHVFRDAQMPKLEHVRRALASSDVVTRILGAAAASRMGLAARPLLDELVAGLHKGAHGFDIHALEAIRKLGPEASQAAPVLAKGLHVYAGRSLPAAYGKVAFAADRDVGYANVAALRALGPSAHPAVRAAVTQRSYVRPLVMQLARELGAVPKRTPRKTAPAPTEPAVPAPSAWLVRMEGEVEAHGVPRAEFRSPRSGPPKWESFYALYDLKARAVPALLHGVAHGSEKVRTTCLEILWALGTHAKAAGPALFELALAEPSNRARALRALGNSGAKDPAWVHRLTDWIDEAGHEARIGAIRTLTNLGRDASSADKALRDRLAAVLRSLPPPKPGTHRPAGWPFHPQPVVLEIDALVAALGRIDGSAAKAAPLLLRVGTRNLVSLGSGTPKLGFPGPPWTHPDPRTRNLVVRDTAVFAVRRLGVDALPAIRRALVADDAELRAMAAKALAGFPLTLVGRSARDAAADPDPGVRRAAIDALAAFADESSLRALRTLLDDDDPAVVGAAVGALHEVGPRAEAAASGLLPLLVSHPRLRVRILDALQRTTTDPIHFYGLSLASGLREGWLKADQAIWRMRQSGAPLRGFASSVIEALPQMSPDHQSIALRFLNDAAPQDAAFHAALRSLAGSAPGVTRRRAMRWMATLGLDDAASLAVLTAQLGHMELRVAHAAAETLADLAPTRAAARAPLEARLDDPRDIVRAQAVRGLARTDARTKATKAALALLRSDDPDPRAIAVQAIAQIGDVTAALEPLKRMLAQETAHRVRLHVLDAIASTGPQGLDVVGTHQRTLKRGSAAWHRGRNALRFGRRHIVPELRMWVRSKDLGTYAAACFMLGEIGADAKDAVPDLLALADSGWDQGQGLATQALLKIRGADAITRTLLDRCLRGDTLERNGAVHQLAKLDEATHIELLPALAEALPHLRGHVLLQALAAIRPLERRAAPVAPAILASVRGSAAHERRALLAALGPLLAETPAVRAALLHALDDPDAGARGVAATALIDHDAGRAGSIERAGRLLLDPDPAVRRAVATSLERMGRAALPALPSLLHAASNDEGPTMQASFRTLAQLEPGSSILRPVLLRLAGSKDAWRRSGALSALGHVRGPDPLVDRALSEGATSWDWRIKRGAELGQAARR